MKRSEVESWAAAAARLHDRGDDGAPAPHHQHSHTTATHQHNTDHDGTLLGGPLYGGGGVPLLNANAGKDTPVRKWSNVKSQ